MADLTAGSGARHTQPTAQSRRDRGRERGNRAWITSCAMTEGSCAGHQFSIGNLGTAHKAIISVLPQGRRGQPWPIAKGVGGRYPAIASTVTLAAGSPLVLADARRQSYCDDASTPIFGPTMSHRRRSLPLHCIDQVPAPLRQGPITVLSKCEVALPAMTDLHSLETTAIRSNLRLSSLVAVSANPPQADPMPADQVRGRERRQ